MYTTFQGANVFTKSVRQKARHQKSPTRVFVIDAAVRKRARQPPIIQSTWSLTMKHSEITEY